MYSAWKRQKWFTETMWQNSNKYYMKWSILHWLKTLSALQLNRAFDLCISVVNERCVPRSTRPNVCIKYVLLGRDNCRLTMTGRLESTSDACEEGPFPFSSDHKTTSSLFSCFSVLLTVKIYDDKFPHLHKDHLHLLCSEGSLELTSCSRCIEMHIVLVYIFPAERSLDKPWNHLPFVQYRSSYFSLEKIW